MAITRMTTYGPGGYDQSLPYNNLVSIEYTDDETGEVTTYVPPDIPDPLPKTTDEMSPPEASVEDRILALERQLTRLKGAGSAHSDREEREALKAAQEAAEKKKDK